MDNRIKRVTFELNNWCPNAKAHSACPLHLEDEPKSLSSKVVFNTLNYLGKNKYEGIIAFHNYCEPLTDPRLLLFIKTARRTVKKSRIYILTSGWNLNKILLEELYDNGVDLVKVSAYSIEEYNRLKTLKDYNGYIVFMAKLDDRINGGTINREASCHAPYAEIVIRHTGDIVLCCWDWKSENVFGNLNKTSLGKILKNKEMKKIYDKLSKGNRYLSICKTCNLKDRYN